MRKIIFILCLCVCVGACFGQEHQKPLTKAEIMQWLQPAPGKKSEQGDLAGEIATRGIAFKVDEKTLEEFRKAGARVFVIAAIKEAAEAAARPKDAPPENNAPTAGNNDAPLTEADLKKLPLLERARHQAANFMEELPNFIVTQHVQRYIRTPQDKDWKTEDKLEIELTYNQKDGEKFKLLKINGKTSSQNYDTMQGATSTGEFGSLLAALFAPQSYAEFKEVRKEDFHGYKTVLYTFKVKKANSAHQITDKTSGRSVIAGYEGTVWIDQETASVVRVEQSANDIQKGFAMTMAESAIEYDWITVAGTKYMLPIYAEMLLGSDSERFYSRNVIEMRNYKIFDTDMKIILDDPPAKIKQQ